MKSKKKTTRTSRKMTKTARAKKPAKRAPRRDAAMDQEAMMAAFQKAMTPGDGHERLKPFAGSWRTRTTMIMAPGADPEVTEGTSENDWVLGGRYLQQKYHGTAMGMPFEGLGYTGYDNVRGKYVGTWMDTFGTGLMNSIGVGRPTATQMDSEAEVYEPTGKRGVFVCKVKLQDNDHHTFEMWRKAPNGKKFRMMVIEYSRA